MSQINKEKIKSGLDTLFISSDTELNDIDKELFEALGIQWFAEIYMRSKKYGFATSQKILSDLIKLSFFIYENLDDFPIRKKVILPRENGSYKFIVTTPSIDSSSAEESKLDEEIPLHSLTKKKIYEAKKSKLDEEISKNSIVFLSTWDDAHSKIADRLWLDGIKKDLNTFAGAWID